MIECYYSACPNHSAHPVRPDGDYDGPFCNNNDCTLNPVLQPIFDKARAAQSQHHTMTFVDGGYWYNHEGQLFLGGKVDNKLATIGFHDGDTYIQFSTEVDRDDISSEMYIRQMMLIMHNFDISEYTK